MRSVSPGVVGLTDAEIRALQPGESPGVFSDAARAVIEFTDEVHHNVRAGDEARARVRRHLDDRQLVELVVTIGYFGLVCRVLETLGVDREGA